MVDGEIAEIEETVAHSRVLPIHDPDGDAVIDEVGVEQIVVAEHRWLRAKGALDRDPDGLGGFVRRGQTPAVAHRGQRVGLDDPEGREGTRDGPRLVDPSQRLRDSLQHDRLVERVIADRLSFDETCDEHSLGLDEGDHVRPDARGRREMAGLALHPAVDTQQATALRRYPDDKDFAIDGDPIIPVRDTAGKRLGGPWPAMPAWHPIEDRRTEQLDLHRSIA